MATLLPLREHIAWLNLGRSKVGDGAATTLAGFPRLARLDLHETAIGDHGVGVLVACTELRSLNLHGTKVGDAGIRALAGLPRLERLYLWRTDASATAVSQLQRALPQLKVVLAAELPEPMTGEQGGGRRRRG